MLARAKYAGDTSGGRPFVSPMPATCSHNTQCGPKPSFAKNESISPDLTNGIKVLLDGRNKLEDSKIVVLSSLLEVYVHSGDAVNLLLEGSHLDLKGKQVLLLAKQRLLGQLSAVTFCSTKAKDIVEFPNFPVPCLLR